MDVCSLEDLRQRFEPPNESNRWDCLLPKVHMGRCHLPPPDGPHLYPLGPSSAAPKANPPGTRPGLTKSSFKRAPGAVLADSVPVAIAEGPSIPAAGSSRSRAPPPWPGTWTRTPPSRTRSRSCGPSTHTSSPRSGPGPGQPVHGAAAQRGRGPAVRAGQDLHAHTAGSLMSARPTAAPDPNLHPYPLSV